MASNDPDRLLVAAIVTVSAGSKWWVAPRLGGGNYQAACSPRLHFGLGQARLIERVEVTWPSGKVDRHENLAADRGDLLREGELTVRPLTGWGNRP